MTSLSPEPLDRPARHRWLIWLRWAGTVLALGLLVYLLATQGWQETWLALRQIPTGYFILTIGIMIVSRLTVCGRWYTLLHSAGTPVTLWQSIRLTFAGLFAANFLPTTIGGDVVRMAGCVQLGFDSAASAASLVMDRLVGMAGMAAMLPVGLARLAAAPIPAGMQVFPPAALAGLLSDRFSKVWDWGVRFLQSLWQILMRWSRRPLSLLAALMWTFGHMACLFSAVWVLFHSMGQVVSWWTVGGLWVLSYFVTLLPISVNGLGVQEVSLTYLYTTFGGVGVEQGLAMAVLIRLLYLLVSLPGAAFVPGLLSARVPPQPQPTPPPEGEL
jgi:hypothetical protein